MGRKQQQQEEGDAAREGMAAFAAAWAAVPAGERAGKGVYSLWKTDDGGMHLSFRPDGDEGDSHLPIPGGLLQMLMAAADGKGPLGRLRALATGLGGG